MLTSKECKYTSSTVFFKEDFIYIIYIYIQQQKSILTFNPVFYVIESGVGKPLNVEKQRKDAEENGMKEEKPRETNKKKDYMDLPV